MAVLLQLTADAQGKTLGQLAGLFHTNKRTMRRDIEALKATGYPIDKKRDGKTVRYFLTPAASPPHLSFDIDDALALFHAVRLSPLFGSEYHERLELALVKLEQFLPAGVRTYLGKFKGDLVHRAPHPLPPQFSDVLKGLLEQEWNRRRVRLTYESLRKITERVVDPYYLQVHDGELWLLGYCHLRGQMRRFLVAGIRHAEYLDEEFTLPPGFDPQDLLDTSLGIAQGPPHVVKMRFRGVAARRVELRPLHPKQRVVERTEEAIVVEVPARGRAEVVQAALRYGARAEVLGPPQFREAIRAEVERLSRVYGTE